MFDGACLEGLRRRAEQTLDGEAFAIPESLPAAEIVATLTGDPSLREEANAWFENGASYHTLLRMTAAALEECSASVPSAEPMYVPKAEGELEP